MGQSARTRDPPLHERCLPPLFQPLIHDLYIPSLSLLKIRRVDVYDLAHTVTFFLSLCIVIRHE